MMRSFTHSFCVLVICSMLVYGCSKSGSTLQTGSTTNSSHLPAGYFTTDASMSPYYGDTVLYVRGNDVASYQFKPVNNLGAGTYVSWPAGLSIDGQTGVIDVSKSEPGARYNVGFVHAITGDTTYSQVVLAGATYPDGIYYRGSANATLQPYFVAGNSANNDVFDAQGPAMPRAVDQHLLVNSTDGSIDLNNSVNEGLFGANPQNGETRQITVYYRLNDNSNMSLQKTTLTLHYYNTISDVPADLIAATEASQGFFATHVQTLGTGTPATPVAKAKAVATPAPVAPRPPQIVIVNVGPH